MFILVMVGDGGASAVAHPFLTLLKDGRTVIGTVIGRSYVAS